MIKIPLEQVGDGMVLGKSLYSGSGELLLAAGYHLNSRHTARLKVLGFSMLWIQEEGTEHVVPEEMINEHLALQTNDAVRESVALIKAAADTKGKTKEEIDKTVKDSDRFKNILMADKIKSALAGIVDHLLMSQDLTINLNSIRGKDNYLFQHCLDVAVISILLGHRLNLNRYEVEELALGALLHDLGKVVIPGDLQSKGKRLNYQEFVILKEHTTYGYNILRENPRISPVSAHVAYQHHERQDGGGFPRGLKGTNELPTQKKLVQPRGTIHRYAEIVSVANTYDNLVSPHPALDPKSPDEALKMLLRAAGTQLNRHVVDALTTITPAFPVGAYVSVVGGPKELLGSRGVVSRVNVKDLEHPEILILYNKNRQRLKPISIDTSASKEVKIQFVMRL